MDILVLQTKDATKYHRIILGRPWLATANVFIGCREGILTISNGPSLQNLTMYPPAQPMAKLLWLKNPYGDEEIEQPLLSISQSRGLEDQKENNILDQFISATTSVDFAHSFSEFDYFLTEDFQEHFDPMNISTSVVLFVDEKMEVFTIPIEVSPGNSLLINARLGLVQQDLLVHVL